MPRKPSIYLDTSFISSYWYEGNDLDAFTRRLSARDWWDLERQHFDLRVSTVTLEELRAGKFRRQADALEMASRIRRLTLTAKVRLFSIELVAAGVVPESKPNDAAQMAYAAVHNIDYLITWNYAHLANVEAQRRLDEICRRKTIRPPNMVSPDTIPRVSLGQEIRRPEYGDDR